MLTNILMGKPLEIKSDGSQENRLWRIKMEPIQDYSVVNFGIGNDSPLSLANVASFTVT